MTDSDVLSDLTRNPGDVMARLATLERTVQAIQTARRLEGAAVGRGGIRIHDGGQLVLDDVDGLRAFTAAPTGIFVHNGASIEALDGGSITARYPDGRAAAIWGSIVNAQTGDPQGHGVLIQAGDEEDGRDIFRAMRRVDGQTGIFTGHEGTPIDVIILYAEEFAAVSSGSNGLRFDANGEGNVLFAVWDEGYVRMFSEDADVRTSWTSTGESANCYLDGDGKIHRVTSSREHKTAIQDLTVDPDAVLRMRPRTWLPADEVPCSDTSGNGTREKATITRTAPARRQVGFVAEELDELGLGDFVQRDDDGQPDGIRYDRLSAALLSVVQRQQSQIDELSARVSALEAT